MTALLSSLCVRLQPHRSKAPLSAIIPAYERLLAAETSSTDHATSTTRMLHCIRSALASEPSVYDASFALDTCLDKFFALTDAQTTRKVGSPLNETLRMLVALAGGDDGDTFMVEDPTRIDAIQQAHQVNGPRVGESIHMANDKIVASSQQALFQKTTLPLHSDRVLGHFEFSTFRPNNPALSALWYPEVAADNDVSAPCPFTPAVSSIALLRDESVPQLIDFSQPPASADRRKEKAVGVHELRMQSPPWDVSRRKQRESEVLFFDSTKMIKLGIMNSSTDDGSVTEASSLGDKEDSDMVEWSQFVDRPQAIGSWEDLDEQLISQSRAVPVTMRPITTESCIEVDEADIVEDAAKALVGIGSVLFRRIIRTASIQLPSKHRIKLRTSSPTSLHSLLQDFCTAATSFLRLEFLSVYFSQDPARGGKTAQALANALQHYLASYQASIQALNQPNRTTPLSLTWLLFKTRHLRRQIVQLAHCLGCGGGDDGDFWRLLSGREFLRGVWLLNSLYAALLHDEREDASGHMTRLLSWLVVRASAPFVTLLSSYVATGSTPLELDPYGEFRLTIASTLIGHQGVEDSDDTLLSQDLLPGYLNGLATRVLHIGHVQQMLHKILPHSETLAQDQVHLPYHISEAVVALDQITSIITALAKRVEVACLSASATGTSTRRPVRSPTKSPRSFDHEKEWVANKRKRLEENQQNQEHQRQLLDDLVRAKNERNQAQAAQERTAELTAIHRAGTEAAKRVQDGKRLLVAKYNALMNDADDRHQYMRWRRDRAVRLPRAKTELAQLLETEAKSWEDTARSSDENGSTDPITAIDTHVQGGDGDQDMQEVDPVAQPVPKAVAVSISDPAIAETVDGDGGLLWRPRIRTQHVPGGGGNDAKAAMYPGTLGGEQLPRRMDAHRSSIVVIAPSGGGSGAGAFESIYGPRVANNLNEESKATTDASMNENAVDEVMTTPPPSTTDVVDEPLKDVAMDHEEDEKVEALHDGLQRVSTAVDEREPASSEIFPIASLLQPATSFFTEDVTADDSMLLKSVLQPGVVERPPPPPFSLLVRMALEEPINLIHDALDRMAVQALMTKLDIRGPLQWLHRVMLMSEGLCMSIFSSDLLAKLRAQDRVLLAMPGRLTTMLGLAMIEARVIRGANQLPSFKYTVSDAFITVVSTGPALPSIARVVEELTLQYSVSSHVAIVLSAKTMDAYLSTHRFLLLTRLTEQEAREIWLTWRKSELRHATTDTELRRRCDLALHFAQTFLAAFHESFASQILMIRWKELCSSLLQSQSVTQLRNDHERFVGDARACCFLDECQAEIRASVLSLVEAVWVLGSLLRAAEAHGSSLALLQSQLDHVVAVQATSMRVLLSQLYQEENCMDECRRVFAKHFILRLNLNGFFVDTTT